MDTLSEIYKKVDGLAALIKEGKSLDIHINLRKVFFFFFSFFLINIALTKMPFKII